MWLNLSICLDPRYIFTFAFSAFFFSPTRMDSNITWIHCVGDKVHYSHIVHRFHDTIHTLINYFATVFPFLISAKISYIQMDSKC